MSSMKWIQGIVISLSVVLSACGGSGGDDSGGGDTDNSIPTATITSPADGSAHPGGSDISFTGTGADDEDGVLSDANLEWSSHIDGLLGTGAAVSFALSTGEHIITLEATDSGGATDTDTITLTVDAISAAPVISQFTMDPEPAYSTVATTFYWQVSDPEGDTLTCTLDVNDDGTDDYTVNDCANIASQEHTYTVNGDFTAKLTVRDNGNEVQTLLPLIVTSPLLLEVSVNEPVSENGRALSTITVSNVSALPMDDVSVVYTVPPEFQFDIENDAEPNATGCETPCTGGQDASWILGTLVGGESRTITVNAIVVPGVSAGVQAQTIVSVQVSSSSITEVISVSRAVVMDNNPKSQLAMSFSKDPVMPGDNLILTVDVGNIDNIDLANLELRTLLPVGVSVDSISDSGSQDDVTGDIIWETVSLAEGNTFRRTVNVTVDASAIVGQILAARVELRHDGGVDLDASTEQVATVAEVTFPITLDISATPDPVDAGASLGYEITVHNVSAAPVNDVHMVFRVPPGLQFNAVNDAEPDATGCGAACIDDQEAFWTVATLNSDERYIVTVDALVDANQLSGSLITTSVRVTATGTGDDIDRLKTVVVAPEPVVDALDLAGRSGCLGCHGIENALFGPAWKDVAERYRGNADAKATLTVKVRNGGSGSWGMVPMPPTVSTVSDADIEVLVDFILGL